VTPGRCVVEALRGDVVESVHRVHVAVVHGDQGLIASAGNPAHHSFVRSSIKMFQALPLVEGGGIDRFRLTGEELALCAASHGGEPFHVAAARSILAKANVGEAALACGPHLPLHDATGHAMLCAGETPGRIHNNCSGKHAGMLAMAKNLNAAARNYIDADHPVQQSVARILDELCDVATSSLPRGVDGCSVPTWAIPLRNLALGFQRLASGETLPEKRRLAAERIIAAVRANPFMVAGSGRFCTELMKSVPRAFVKTGAEGVFCAAIPHAGIGIALKCEDGARRASEIAIAAVLAGIDVWSPEEKASLRQFAAVKLRNWRKFTVGRIAAADPLPAA
jgi:L-asparaginase II